MSDKWLVVKASGGGGLGDSIKSVLVAALYAKLSDRILVVDWTGGVYGDGVSNPFSSVFKITGIESSPQIPDSEDVYPAAWKGRLKQSLHEVYTEDGWQNWDRARTIKHYSIDLSKLDYIHDVLVMWEFDQLAKLSALTELGDVNDVFIYRRAAECYLDFSDEFANTLKSLIVDENTPGVGVHVRATREFNDNKGGQDIKGYFQAVDALMENGNDLFVATDNLDILNSFKQRYKNVIHTKKWFATPGDSLHMNPECPDKATNLSEALLDIVLLSKCKYLVVTPNSSFSAVAQFFAEHSIEIVEPYKYSIYNRIVGLLRKIVK